MWVRSGGVGLSQTRPIPRSPDGDKKTHLQIREGAQEMILGRLFQKPCPPRPPPNLGNQQVYVAKECTKFPD